MNVSYVIIVMSLVIA